MDEKGFLVGIVRRSKKIFSKCQWDKKEKHKKKGKALDLQQRKEYYTVREQEEEEEKLRKARAKKQQEDGQLRRQVELEERRVERERLKERKALQAPSLKNKRQKRVIGDRVWDRVAPPLSAPSPKYTSRGRSVNLPQKYR
ncbi:hypothetical protein K491DRAFT_709379 [Lophiostoma macrostomum CBS 122681]|uniref:Uncharacterized protein n=1 Tax=Lophiostoma macrostomum CBS 122681 TaxID=1314788 RepID=A0A6A6SJ19_9PLEO|nr:hypothetical protein K491DRAFT_709379 [Lophiostoma macrostomum CBS 122681]